MINRKYDVCSTDIINNLTERPKEPSSKPGIIFSFPDNTKYDAKRLTMIKI